MSLRFLRDLYREVIVPWEVADEIAALRSIRFVQPEFARAAWLNRLPAPASISPWLLAALDRGEAAVIQSALDRGISTVCIDEAAGRRIAQLNGLRVTGSLGILVRGKREGKVRFVRDAIASMRAQGVWLSESIMRSALAQAGE